MTFFYNLRTLYYVDWDETVENGRSPSSGVQWVGEQRRATFRPDIHCSISQDLTSDTFILLHDETATYYSVHNTRLPRIHHHSLSSTHSRPRSTRGHSPRHRGSPAPTLLPHHSSILHLEPYPWLSSINHNLPSSNQPPPSPNNLHHGPRPPPQTTASPSHLYRNRPVHRRRCKAPYRILPQSPG